MVAHIPKHWFLGGAIVVGGIIVGIFYFRHKPKVSTPQITPKQTPITKQSDPFDMELKKSYYIMDVNTIINGAYHSAVLSGFVIANSMLSKKLFKTKPADLGQFTPKDSIMLTVNIYMAMMTKQALIKNKILPPNIHVE